MEISQHKKTREDILEAKRMASKERYKKIKSDPILNEKRKKKDKENYIQAKKFKKKLSINEKAPEQQEEQREKWRINSRKLYEKKKKEREVLYIDTNDDNLSDNRQQEVIQNETDPLEEELILMNSDSNGSFDLSNDKKIKILSDIKVNYNKNTLRAMMGGKCKI